MVCKFSNKDGDCALSGNTIVDSIKCKGRYDDREDCPHWYRRNRNENKTNY